MNAKTTIAIIMIMTIGFMAVVLFTYYQHLAGRPGTMIIPAGGTYLGPNTPK